MKNKRGIALISALVFILIFMISAAWLASQMSGHLKITSNIKSYERLFAMADGTLAKGILYIKKTFLEIPGWDPRVTAEITNNLPSYLSGTKNNITYKSRIFYRGYSSKPPPGFMINQQGYSKYHQLFYEVTGEAKKSQSKSEVSALYIKITK